MQYKSIFNKVLIFLLGVILISLPLFTIFPAESWHDNQRYGQITIFFLTIIIYYFNRDGEILILNKFYNISIASLILLSFFSCLFSRKPVWAMAEVAIFICSLFFAKILILRRGENAEEFDKYFLSFIFLLSFLIIFKFSLNYLFFENDWNVINLWDLIPGFDNPRFFGQFATLIAPILCIPIVANIHKKSAFVIAVLWWVMIIASGTRGTWVGLIIFTVIIASTGGLGKIFAKTQLVCAVAGCLLYILFFSLILNIFDVNVVNSAGDRINTSLSEREYLWNKALNMVAERPILGFGPMHFADDAHPAAAHPHQMILQFASECGLIFVFILLLILIFISFSVYKEIRKINSLKIKCSDYYYIGLSFSVGASLVQSMVDGVFVMPHTEIWFVIFSAWLFAIHRGNNFKIETNNKLKFLNYLVGLLFFSSAILLVFIMIRDAPGPWRDYKYHINNSGEIFLPRFWVQGIINEAINN